MKLNVRIISLASLFSLFSLCLALPVEDKIAESDIAASLSQDVAQVLDAIEVLDVDSEPRKAELPVDIFKTVLEAEDVEDFDIKFVQSMNALQSFIFDGEDVLDKIKEFTPFEKVIRVEMFDPDFPDAVIDATAEEAFKMEIVQEDGVVISLKINDTEVLQRLKGFTENSRLNMITLGSPVSAAAMDDDNESTDENVEVEKEEMEESVVTSVTEATTESMTSSEATTEPMTSPETTTDSMTSPETTTDSMTTPETTTDSMTSPEATSTKVPVDTMDVSSTTTGDASSTSTDASTTPESTTPEPTTQASTTTTTEKSTPATTPSILAAERNEVLGSVSGISSMIMGIVNSVSEARVNAKPDAIASDMEMIKKEDMPEMEAVEESVDEAMETVPEEDKIAMAAPLSIASPDSQMQKVVPVVARSYPSTPYEYRGLRRFLQNLFMNRKIENPLSRMDGIKTLECNTREKHTVNPGEALRLFNKDEKKCEWKLEFPKNSAFELTCSQFVLPCKNPAGRNWFSLNFKWKGAKNEELCQEEDDIKTGDVTHVFNVEDLADLTRVEIEHKRRRNENVEEPLNCILYSKEKIEVVEDDLAIVTETDDSESPSLDSLFDENATEDKAEAGEDVIEERTECGVARSAHNRIVAGEKAVGDEFPWMVQLDVIRVAGRRKRVYLCGGSILNKNWILTAAHCLENIDYARVNLGCTPDFNSCQKTLRVDPSNFHIHSGYDNVLSGDDIALIRISEGIEFTEKVGPVCLPSLPKAVQEDLVIIGFGHTGDNGLSSSVLKKGLTTTVPDAVCLDEFGRLLEASKSICAVTTTATGSKSAENPESSEAIAKGEICFGDSGSFAGSLRAGRYEIDGISSYGDPYTCEGPPQGFTEVHRYLEWIAKHVTS